MAEAKTVVVNHRRGTLNSQFKCPVCIENMCYLNKGNLKRHMLKHHVPSVSATGKPAQAMNGIRYFCPIHCAFSSAVRRRVVDHIRRMHPGMEAFPPTVQHVVTAQKQGENVHTVQENERLRIGLQGRTRSPKFRLVPAHIHHIMRENVQDFVAGGFWASPRDLKDYLLNRILTRKGRMPKLDNDNFIIKSVNNKTGFIDVCTSSSAAAATNSTVLPERQDGGRNSSVLPGRSAGDRNNGVFPERSADGRNNAEFPERQVGSRNNGVLPERPVKCLNNAVFPERSAGCRNKAELPERQVGSRNNGVLPERPAKCRNNAVFPKRSAEGKSNGVLPERPAKFRNNGVLPERPTECRNNDAFPERSTEGRNCLNIHNCSTTLGISRLHEHRLNIEEDGLENSMINTRGTRRHIEPTRDTHPRQFDLDMLQSDLFLSDSSDSGSTRSPRSRARRKCPKEHDAGETLAPSAYDVRVQTTACSQSSKHHLRPSSENSTFTNEIKNESICTSKRRQSFSENVVFDNSNETDTFESDNLKGSLPESGDITIRLSGRPGSHSRMRQYDTVGNNGTQGAPKHPSITNTIPLHRGQINTSNLKIISHRQCDSEHCDTDREIYGHYNSEKVECWISQHSDFFGDPSAYMNCEDIVEPESRNDTSAKYNSSTRDTDLELCHSEGLGTCGSSECQEDDIRERSEESPSSSEPYTSVYSVTVPNTLAAQPRGPSHRPHIRLRFSKVSAVTSTCRHPANVLQGCPGEAGLQDIGEQPARVSAMMQRSNASMNPSLLANNSSCSDIEAVQGNTFTSKSTVRSDCMPVLRPPNNSIESFKINRHQAFRRQNTDVADDSPESGVKQYHRALHPSLRVDKENTEHAVIYRGSTETCLPMPVLGSNQRPECDWHPPDNLQTDVCFNKLTAYPRRRQKQSFKEAAQSGQTQYRLSERKDGEAIAQEQFGFNDVGTNKVKLTLTVVAKKKIRTPNGIMGYQEDSKMTNTSGQSSEHRTRSESKFRRKFKKSKRRNIYGFKKRKTKPTVDGHISTATTVPRIEADGELNKNSINRIKKVGLNVVDHKVRSRKMHQRNRAARSPWGTWAPCSLDCGLGQQERVRSCGTHCQEIESKPCLNKPCEGSKMTDKWSYYEMFDLTETDVTIESGDPCEKWMKCSNKSIQHYLTNIVNLPNCPCRYPVDIDIRDSIYDDEQERHFLWEDASGDSERNDVYKPGAKYCIRSLLPRHSVTLAAQHCCYDDKGRLITRGRDAGTPNLVSPQLSRELHKKVDILPWILCKGDWTRYNRVVQPNNHRQCTENPCLGEIRHQIDRIKSY